VFVEKYNTYIKPQLYRYDIHNRVNHYFTQGLDEPVPIILFGKLGMKNEINKIVNCFRPLDCDGRNFRMQADFTS
jgi:hypothetical protein